MGVTRVSYAKIEQLWPSLCLRNDWMNCMWLVENPVLDRLE